MGLERGPVGRLWRGRIREARHDVEVVVKQTEDGIQIILPDHSVPREICERVARRLTAKIDAQVRGVELPPEQVVLSTASPIPILCDYCLEKLGGLGYRCHRCGGQYCEEHRLPERHDCPGGKGSEFVAAAPRRVEVSPLLPEYDEVIVLHEVPCG
jgi:hypothetical protein